MISEARAWMKLWIYFSFLTLIYSLILTGCSRGTHSLTPDSMVMPSISSSLTATQVLLTPTTVQLTGTPALPVTPSEQFVTTPTPQEATQSFTSTPTQTTTATLTPSLTATRPWPTVAGNQAVYIYLIQTKTGGSVACGDSLVSYNTGLPRTGDNATDITAALQRLFVKKQYFGKLYNPVYRSNIQVVSVRFKSYSGIAEVRLAGTYVRSGDRCDDRRVREQVWTTIRQFPGVKVVDILLNENLLGDILATGK